MSSRSSGGTLNPTRQQLDELDALLQRMLKLPVNQLEDPPSGPDSIEAGHNREQESAPSVPATTSSLSAARTRWTNQDSEEAARNRLAMLPPQKTDATPLPSRPELKLAPREVTETDTPPPPAPPKETPTDDDDSADWVPLRAAWQPSAQTWQPLAQSWKQAQAARRRSPSRPAAEQPAPIPEKPAPQRLPALDDQTPMPTPFRPMVPTAPEPVTPPPAIEEDPPLGQAWLPLLWFDRVFDLWLDLWGPLGNFFRKPTGRNLLGISGLLCLGTAIAWLFCDLFAWCPW